MPKNIITEDHIEQEALKFLENEGYEIVYGPKIAPAPEGNGERKTYKEVVLEDRLRKAIKKMEKKLCILLIT